MRRAGASLLGPFPTLKRRIAALAAPPDQAALAAFAKRTPTAKFIQIGSNDGLTNDPVRPFVDRHHWRGVCVEPVPSIFQRLQANYAGVDGMEFACAAVGDEIGTATFYSVAGSDPSDPPFVDQIGSFRREHLLAHANSVPNINERIKAEPVPVVRYSDLVELLGAIPDLVHIDAEGTDDVVLRQVLRYTAGLPAAILYEHLHLSDEVTAELRELLRAQGYTLTVGPMDTFASR